MLFAKRLAPVTKIQVQADIQARCLGRGGVDALRAALGKALSADEIPVQIKLVASSHHQVSCWCTDAAKGEGVLNRAISTAAKELKRFAGGALALTSPPRAVDESDPHKAASSLSAQLTERCVL